MKVIGKRITKPMLITAFGVRRIRPRVVHTQESAKAKTSTRATAATIPNTPPRGSKPMINPSPITRLEASR